MAPATVPSSLPARLVAGTTWRWDRTVDGYRPADGWALKIHFRGAGHLTLTAAANASNSGWEYTGAITSTDLLPAGRYYVTEFVEQGTERYEVGRAVVLVEANPITQVAGAAQPYEEVVLEKLKAYVSGLADDGILEYQIAGRAVKLLTFEEANRMIGDLTAQLQAKARRGRRPPLVPVFRHAG